MGNQSQRKTRMEQCENVDEIKVFRVNNNDSDDNCDEMRDGGSNARDEVIRDEREHNIDINECNVSPYKLRNDDNIDKLITTISHFITIIIRIIVIHSENPNFINILTLLNSCLPLALVPHDVVIEFQWYFRISLRCSLLIRHYIKTE
nr:hypothetical protein [Tanacetum cinerariifolium]